MVQRTPPNTINAAKKQVRCVYSTFSRMAMIAHDVHDTTTAAILAFSPLPGAIVNRTYGIHKNLPGIYLKTYISNHFY